MRECWAKIMIKEKKSAIFLEILCRDYMLELSFEIRSPKLHITPNYHSFSGPNVCLAQLQMELCRAANIFAAR